MMAHECGAIAFALWATVFALLVATLTYSAILQREIERPETTVAQAGCAAAFIIVVAALWPLLATFAAYQAAREWLMWWRYKRWLDTPEGRRSRAERFGRP
jgi:hypothetical protein